jgi:hypothetical protein
LTDSNSLPRPHGNLIKENDIGTVGTSTSVEEELAPKIDKIDRREKPYRKKNQN